MLVPTSYFPWRDLQILVLRVEVAEEEAAEEEAVVEDEVEEAVALVEDEVEDEVALEEGHLAVVGEVAEVSPLAEAGEEADFRRISR